MNSFDGVVYLGLVIAVVTGFNAGLLRSAATILAYLIAMPIAVWAMSLIASQIDGALGSTWAQNSLLLFGIFLIAGMVLGKLMRMALDETIGSEAGIGDRLAGAALGEGPGQPWPFRLGATDGVGEQALAPCSLQRVGLEIEVLVRRRDPGVADKHGAGPSVGVRRAGVPRNATVSMFLVH